MQPQNKSSVVEFSHPFSSQKSPDLITIMQIKVHFSRYADSGRQMSSDQTWKISFITKELKE